MEINFDRPARYSNRSDRRRIGMADLLSRRAALVRSGGTVAAAGIAAVALSQPRPAAAAMPPGALTLYDFGAKANGSDDSPALQKALTVAAAEERVIGGTGDTFTIASPVSVETANHTVKDWGFIGQGDVFKSAITGTSAVIKIQSGAGRQNRALKLMNFSIRGNGAGGNGLVLMAPSGSNFYNILLHNVTVENVGSAGFWLEGNVFETALAYCQATDCKLAGMRFSHGRSGFGGVLSAIHVQHPILAQNGTGLQVMNYARDVVVEGGYIRQSQKYGVYLSNGIDRPWRGTGFENNYISAKPSSTGTCSHIWANNNFICSGLRFYDEFGGARFAIGLPSQSNTSIIRDTARRCGAAASGLGDFLYVGGGNAAVIVDGCSGGDVVIAAGYSGNWKITNSQLESYPDITATYSNL
jgi:hypothetical protein